MNFLTNKGTSPLVIADEVIEALFERLSWMTIKPANVLVVGGEDKAVARVQRQYEEANVQRSEEACANQSVDIIFANMVLPWQADSVAVFKEWRKLLRPEGLLLFSTLGLDTLKECQSLFNVEDLPCLVDMHDIGDSLIASGFIDPVLDVDYYTTAYRDKSKLIAELSRSGMVSSEASDRLHQLAATEHHTYEVTYEVIYAHAFAPLHERNTVEDGVVKIPLSQLRRSL